MKILNIIITLFFFLLDPFALYAQQRSDQIEKVYIIFKTHLDIGFTDLSSKVEQRYIQEFIPKAIAVSQELRAAGGQERYVWTTGSWLIQAYLDQVSPVEVKTLEDAIKQGDIVWNGMPYTVQSETMTKDMFETILKLSHKLDVRFGKKTTSAKMTDVPGHTRGIISALHDAGIFFLQIGVNPACVVPDVPPICLWRNTDGKEIILMYQKDYGEDMLFPDGKKVVSINFTGDNHGPHTVDQVKRIFANLRKKYPKAELVATSLNEVADDLYPMSSMLPVVTSEIGDTWIHGFSSEPIRMAKFRALMRLYSEWLKEGKIDMNSNEAIAFAVRLGMIAEHTWGFCVMTHLHNWDKYDVDIFRASRDLPEFRAIEQSWQEITDYIDKAIALLPANLQKEAFAAIENAGEVRFLPATTGDKVEKMNECGLMSFRANGIELSQTLSYQTYSSTDFDNYLRAFLTFCPQWAILSLHRPGLENTKAQSAVISASLQNCTIIKDKGITTFTGHVVFPADERIDPRVLPEDAWVEYIISDEGKQMDITVSFLNKPANRLPESYWLSFVPSNVVSVIVEKLGYRVDVMDVIVGGGRNMHGIDRYVDIVTSAGTVRITSLDAPVVVPGGKMSAINYSTNPPDIKKGIHFCLLNNLYSTNYSQWFEGSISYRFKLEIL